MVSGLHKYIKFNLQSDIPNTINLKGMDQNNLFNYIKSLSDHSGKKLKQRALATF